MVWVLQWNNISNRTIVSSGWSRTKISQADQNYCEIVHAFSLHAHIDDWLGCVSAHLMDVLGFAFSNGFPWLFYYLLWVHFLENSITAQQNEIFFSCECVFADLGIGADAAFDSTQLWVLGFDVAEGSSNWEFAWKNSQRANDDLILDIALRAIFLLHFIVVVDLLHFGSINFSPLL